MDIAYSRTLPMGFEEAVTALEQTLTEQKFGVLWKLDVRDKLAEKGVQFHGNVKILEVCNPQKAKAVLETEISTAYFLPCKIVVIEEEQNSKIGMVKPSLFMEMLDNPDLRGFAAEVEEILTETIDKVADRSPSLT